MPILPLLNGPGLVMRIPPVDHNYAYSNNIDMLRRHCDFLRSALLKKDQNEKGLRKKLSRSIKNNKMLRRRLKLKAKTSDKT